MSPLLEKKKIEERFEKLKNRKERLHLEIMIALRYAIELLKTNDMLNLSKYIYYKKSSLFTVCFSPLLTIFARLQFDR